MAEKAFTSLYVAVAVVESQNLIAFAGMMDTPEKARTVAIKHLPADIPSSNLFVFDFAHVAPCLIDPSIDNLLMCAEVCNQFRIYLTQLDVVEWKQKHLWSCFMRASHSLLLKLICLGERGEDKTQPKEVT